MEFKINQKEQYGKKYVWLTFKNFKFKWFDDCGEWFISIQICKSYWEISRCGCIKFRL